MRSLSIVSIGLVSMFVLAIGAAAGEGDGVRSPPPPQCCTSGPKPTD